MRRDDTAFIMRCCKDRVIDLAKDINGCRILQRVLERFDHSQIRFIYNELFKYICNLTTNIYGNYVISHVLELSSYQDKCVIIDEIIDDIVELSLHKYGSNVVENCLKHAPDDRKEEILNRLVSVPISHHEFTLVEMLNSKYGNYVIQRAYDIAN